MHFFSDAVLDAADPAQTPALRVSTKYMETFVPVRPVSSGTELQAFLNRAGMLDLYSVGTDAKVHRLRRGQNEAAPYSETPLDVMASQLYLFTDAGGDADLPGIFGLDGTGKLTLATANASGAYTQAVTGPPKATQVIRRFLGVRGVTGKIYINVRLDDGSLGTNFYDLAKGSWGGDVWAPVNGPDGGPAKVKDFTMVTNDPVQSALFAIGTDDEVLFAEDSFRTSSLRKLGKKASHLAVVIDAGKLLNVFAVEAGTGLLWLAKQQKHATGGTVRFENWLRVDPLQSVKAATVQANLRLDNRLEVFALDEAGNLHHARQLDDVRNKPTPWTYLFPLGTGTPGALFTVGRTATGYSEAYTVTADSELRRFWQSPQSEQWFSEKLELPSTGDALARVPTHAVEITAVDAAGLPLTGADIRISASFLVTLWIAGSAYRVSAVDPVSVKCGADGKVVIHQRATALAGASLLIETPRTPLGAPVLVQPNGELQQKLAELDKAAVLDAKDASGKPLLRADLPDRDAVAASLAEISKRSMDLAGTGVAPAAVQHCFVSLVSPAYRPHLDVSSLEGTAWSIDFANGVPVYRDTTVAEVLAYRSEKLRTSRLSAADLAPGELGAAGDGGFLGIDWGSVWSGIRDGVSWVVDGISKIVVSIVDGVTKVLFEIAGKVFEAVLKFAQQALDFVEGVWNYLKVKLEQLYEWLAFLFDFPSFARTAEGVEHTIGVMLDFAGDAVHALRDRVAGGFDTLKGNLKQISDTLVSEFVADGSPSLGGYSRQHQPDATQSHASDHNVFLNALNQNGDRAAATTGTRRLPAGGTDPDPLQGLMDDLKKLATDLTDGDGKRAFDEAFQYFSAIGSDRDQALQLALAGLVKVLEGVASFAIDAAKGVTLLMFDLVEAMIRTIREALFEAWEIPVVSQLYKLFSNGDTLSFTPVKIAAWIIAIPSNILSKVVLDRAPFPDEAALDRFKRDFTAANLRKRMGLSLPSAAPAGPARAEAGLEAADDAFWSMELKHNFLILYCCGMTLRALSEPGQIVLHSSGKGLGPASIVIPVLRLFTSVFTAPWIQSPVAGAPGCTPGEPGFGVTIWICQMLCGPLRGIAIVKLVPDGQPKIYLGETTLTLWGVANLIMTAWNFGDGPKTTQTKLAFSRAMTNIIPGQTLRFLALPALNEPAYFIPAGVLIGLTVVGYIGSVGCAIAEIKTDSGLTAGHRLHPALSAVSATA